VIEMSGRPFSATLPAYSRVRQSVQLGLAVPRPELDQRIEVRVGQMWRDGLVEETRRLVGAGSAGTGLLAGVTASKALGYAQVLKFLDGEWTEAEAQEQTVRATRRFARRQESWFRRDPRVRWLDAARPVPTEVALAVVAESAARGD
jgi:tRNA dimethylallyltransferase